jgi:F-type H+-transporting ATPase subunit a
MEKELWVTGQFNEYMAGPANSILNLAHINVPDSAHPWSDWMVCELVVAAFIVGLFGYLRARLSVDNPGKTQHTFELAYEFFHASAEEIAGHDGDKYVPFFGTLFIFILFLNLIGLFPFFESPTSHPWVPLGFAIVTFFFYHFTGVRTHGFWYIKQFLGPFWWLAFLMLPIELVSHFARPLSLTVRLYGNMFAGDQVYLTFLALTKLLIPILFIALHFFVSFLQAYIFMLLAMVYVGGAISHEH